MNDLVFDKVKGPDKDRWARGEGSIYEVRRDGECLGRVELVRLSSPPPRGSRIRSGAAYLSWQAYPIGPSSPRLPGYYTRKDAAVALARWVDERGQR